MKRPTRVRVSIYIYTDKNTKYDPWKLYKIQNKSWIALTVSFVLFGSFRKCDFPRMHFVVVVLNIPQNPNNINKILSTEIVHTFGTVLNIFENISNICLNHVPIYRVKYTGSEYDIQNNDLVYKTHQQCQNTFDLLERFRKHIFAIYTISIIHVLYFCSFCNLGIFVCLYVYIFV